MTRFDLQRNTEKPDPLKEYYVVQTVWVKFVLGFAGLSLHHTLNEDCLLLFFNAKAI